MSRRSVRAYVAGVVATSYPSFGMVFDAPPKERTQVDTAMIIRMTSTEKRLATPRGGGRKLVTHQITVRVLTPNLQWEASQQHLDDLVQGAKYAMATTPLSPLVTLTDTTAVPTETSYVVTFGESIKDERPLFAEFVTADLTVELIEEVLR